MFCQQRLWISAHEKYLALRYCRPRAGNEIIYKLSKFNCMPTSLLTLNKATLSSICCPVIDRRNVFWCRRAENDLSAVHDSCHSNGENYNTQQFLEFWQQVPKFTVIPVGGDKWCGGAVSVGAPPPQIFACGGDRPNEVGTYDEQRMSYDHFCTAHMNNIQTLFFYT